MSRRVARPTPPTALAVRGLVATVVAVLVSVFLVARGSGVLDGGATVTAVLPAAAGLVPVHAPVHHHGVKVGDVRVSEGAAPDAGEDEPGTRVEMLIAPEHDGDIPADVLVRVVPRTLFGDVRVDLVSRGTTTLPVADGDRLRADRSEEAVLLYDVFTRASDLLASIEPQNLQVTLTALARALDGRGETLGRMIDDVDRAGEHLGPALENAAATSGDIAYLAEDLAAASPQLLETVSEATRLSRIVLDRPGALTRLLDAGLAATGSGVAMAERTVPGAIDLVHDTGVVFDRTAEDTHGVERTLRALHPMGEAGGAAFATGRFNITAVPSFVDPMPYGPEDCPRYPGLAGSTCGPGDPAPPRPGEPAAPGAGQAPEPALPGSDPQRTVAAAAERQTLLALQAAAASEPGSPVPPPADPATQPAAATWTMLAPLVRGTEVTVR